MSLEMEKSAPETLFRPLTSGSCNFPFLSLSLSFSFTHAEHLTLSILFLLARVVFRSRSRPRDSCRGVQRASISVAVSRGFREPRQGFPYPPRCAEPRNVSSGGDALSLRWGFRRRRKERASHGKTFVHSRPTRS